MFLFCILNRVETEDYAEENTLEYYYQQVRIISMVSFLLVLVVYIASYPAEVAR